VRLSRDAEGRFFLRLNPREQICFEFMLRLYPLVPEDYHQLSRSGESDPPGQDRLEASTALLREDIQSQKAHHKRELERLFQDRACYQTDRSGATLKVDPSQIEWLLQVLNDIRVGSWLKLGAPKPRAHSSPRVNASNARYYMAMEFSGLIQMQFLQHLSPPT
jgi:hypothetical protein